MRKFEIILILFFMVVIPEVVFAQGVTIALFVPSLDFQDGVARKNFVTKVSEAVSKSSGIQWDGQAYARAADFEVARQRGSVGVAIVDVEYYLSKLSSYPVVGQLVSNGSQSRSMKVISKSGPAQLNYYLGKKLVLASSSSYMRRFFTNRVLGNEVKSSDYFSEIEDVRDVRSAINAVDLGKADLSLVYDGYTQGYTTVYTTSAVPLPVIVLLSTSLDERQSAAVRSTLSSLSVSGAGIITGSSSYNPSSVNAFKQHSVEGNSQALKYAMVESDVLQLEFSALPVLRSQEGLSVNVGLATMVPPVSAYEQQINQGL